MTSFRSLTFRHCCFQESVIGVAKIPWTELQVPSWDTSEFSRILLFVLHLFQIKDTNEQLGGYLYVLKHVETLFETMPLINSSIYVGFVYNLNVDICHMNVPIYFNVFHYYAAKASESHPFSTYAKSFEKFMYMSYQIVRNDNFSENFVYVLNG